MPSVDTIRERIEQALPESEVVVEDWTGGGDHLRATITSPAFVGLSRIEQHRLVYAIFDGEIGGEIHALSLTTRTPDQEPA